MIPFDLEAALARERQLDTARHFEKVVPPTQKKYDKLKEEWLTFLSRYGIPTENCLLVREEIPTRGRLKAFMEYLVELSVGMIEVKPVVKTVKNKWYSFRAMYQRTTQNLIDDDLGKDVLYFIKTELAKTYGLSLRRRQKQLADALDMQWVITYLWCYDTYEFQHPRCRVQLTLLILILVYTGARPGTIIESSAYRGTNDALKYKDFQLIGLPTASGGVELELKVRLCFEKGRRQTEDTKDDDYNDETEAVQYKWITLREDRGCRGRCPVTFFIGIALADQAFEEFTHAQHILCFRAPAYGRSLKFNIKREKMEIPVFRMVESNGAISETRAVTHSCLHRDLGGGGRRAGFRDNLKPYNIRRGTANAIDGSNGVSASQYSQLLGHAVKDLGASYISDISGIDGQNIVNKQKTRQDHIDVLRSMRLHMDLTVPSELPYHQNRQLFDDPTLKKLEADEINLYQEILDNYPSHKDSMGSDLYKQHQIVMGQRKRCYTSLHEKSYQKYRREYFRDADSEEVRLQITEGPVSASSRRDTTKEDDVSSMLNLISPVYFPERSFIADAMYLSPVNVDGLPDPGLLENLQAMCSPKPYILYYPKEAPTDGQCPVCNVCLTDLSMRLYQYPEHIHNCFKKQRQERCNIAFKTSRVSYCQWKGCGSHIGLKKQLYLPRAFGMQIQDKIERRRARNVESKRLHQIRRKGITHSSLASLDIASESRSPKSVTTHLRKHVQYQIDCHWGTCTQRCNSEFELRRHLQNCHHVMIRNSPFEPLFCLEHPERGWFECEFEWEDHCQIHLEGLRLSCNFSRSYHTMIKALRCPYCLGNCELPAAERTLQYPDLGLLNRHMDIVHFKDSALLLGDVKCPHPLCSSQEPFPGLQDLKIHFFETHELKEKGFAKSRASSTIKRHRPKMSSRNPSECLISQDESIGDSAYGSEDEFEGWSDDCSDGFNNSLGDESWDSIDTEEQRLQDKNAEDISK